MFLMRLRPQNYHDIERIIEFDFVRATEAAALNSLSWLGRGEKEKADEAACDAMRGMFDLMNICGEVVIGEGIKDDVRLNSISRSTPSTARPTSRKERRTRSVASPRRVRSRGSRSRFAIFRHSI